VRKELRTHFALEVRRFHSQGTDQPNYLKGVSLNVSTTRLVGLLALVGWYAPPVTRRPLPVTGYQQPAQRPTSARVSYVSNSGTLVDVVLVAHQDDWQLFMGDVIAGRIQAGRPIVFIYLTAGDDGRDSLYWTTRERGALESTRVAAARMSADSTTTCSMAKALEHAIRKCVIGNTESYFFRLPDGRRDGQGFERYSYQSLRKLRERRISSTSAVDGRTTYDGWPDLVATVTSLVGEGSTDRAVTIHTSDPSVVVNPHDHFDHRMAGLLAADSRRKNKWNVVYYAGYALASRAPNRSKNQTRQKVALFQAYDAVMTRINPGWGAYREHPAFYAECMMRTYGRRILWR
jgi:LmbE family N-acetylglucosaminyl deacetylase